MSTAPATAEAKAAHEIVTELRTTIATQALPYQHGTEERALGSLYDVFKKVRETVLKYPESARLARVADLLLNRALRPFMAKWHLRKERGLLTSRDAGDEFRGELRELQGELRRFARVFHRMAYRAPWRETGAIPVMPASEMATLRESVRLGIPPGLGIEEGVGPRAGADEYGSGRLGINAREAEEVAKRRRNMRVVVAEGYDAVGLAFSGGGIRSATFCLGVTQVLAEKKLLKDVDFLSTVSGGGYTGSFLTRQIGGSGDWEDVAKPRGPDTEPIRHLRHRAKFLTARSLWEAWGMVTATVAGLLLNWTAPLLVLVVFAIATVATRALEKGGMFWLPYAFQAVGVAVVLGLFYFGFLRIGSLWANRAGRWMGLAVAAGLAALVAAVLNKAFGFLILHGGVARWTDPVWSGRWISAWSLGAIAALIPVILRFVPLLERPAIRKVVTKVALLIAGIFVPALGLAIFFILCAVGRIENVVRGFSGLQVLCALAVLLTLLAIFLLNINLTGPHRLYRNGLSKTFVERDETQDVNFPLHALNGEGMAPYHLINAAVNLPTSTTAGLRERGCDFFLFSKHWSGSPVVKYRPSQDWLMNGRPADLATAMAISGAAFSANMGLGSVPPLRALLAFLNVRLGFWIRRPDMAGLWGFPKAKHPGFSCLLREMGGFAMAENHRWLNLSDGGHIENLGVYELLRRRCKFIVCVDGEADPTFTFQGLMTVVRHAQIDFGVQIAPGLSDLRPDEQTRLCRSHFHLCRIDYPSAGPEYPAATGLLLYVKLSVTGNESELIRRYRGNHADFPHQTTLDQFFDQEQFEAYRQLGVHAAEGLFLPALMSGAPPRTMAAWFTQLAANLLEPLPRPPG